MSIFSKIFGSKHEDEDDESPKEREDLTPGTADSMDSPAEKDVKGAALTPELLPAEELPKSLVRGFTELGAAMKLISESLASQRATAEALTDTSRRQLEILEDLGSKVDRIADGSDPTIIKKIGESLREEIKLISNLDRSIAETNRKLAEALEKMSGALEAIPAAEERQVRVIESIKSYLGDTADMKKMIYTMAESINAQSRSVNASNENLRSGIAKMSDGLSEQGRTRNVLLIIMTVLLAVIMIAVLFSGSPRGAAPEPAKPTATGTTTGGGSK